MQGFFNRYIVVVKSLCCVAASLFAASNAHAQKMNITVIELIGEKIVIHYDLEDNNPSHEYAISLYSSNDKFSVPLTKVSGDVGNEVKPGSNKVITWDIIGELGRFNGPIEFQVKGKVFIPFIKLNDFNSSLKYKRGKSYPLLWNSGNMSGQVDIELYIDNIRVSSDRNVPNTGRFEWFIPGNVKPGKNYHLRFTNTKNRDDVIESAVFRIVPKIPTVLKGIGFAVFGGSIALISSLGGSGTPTGEPDLPPPALPN